jgi:CubicO group peptidase (beta-lactamase class C family)
MPSDSLTGTEPVSRRALLRGGALLGGGLALSGVPGAPALARAVQSAGIEAQWPKVTELVSKYVAQRKVAGTIAALGWGTQDPVYIARGTEGFADRDRAGSNSLFRAYSQTKPVTGMAAMILIDEGKLKLDQPIADFIPEMAAMKVALDPKVSLDARPAKNQITVRHLLTHTAGFGYAGVGKNLVDQELLRLGVTPAVVSRRSIPGVTPPVKTLPPDEFLKVAASVPLVAEPGTVWNYSMSLDILGLVIERAAGAKSFAAFMQERLFDPLGMTSSYFQVPRSERHRLTTNYGLRGGLAWPIDQANNSIYLDPPAFAFGGAGLACSPADYDRFLKMLANRGLADGKRVMSEAAVQLGTSNLLPDGIETKGTFIEGAGNGAGGRVGLGNDAGTFGWAGAAGTVGFVNTRIGLRAGVYVQYMPSQALPIQNDFPRAVLADVSARAPKG